jgi:hypothetical protein
LEGNIVFFIYSSVINPDLTDVVRLCSGWWNFVDEPATGRWPDGENSNYGLFTLADDTYSILASTMTTVFGSAPQWHLSGVAPCSNPGSNLSTISLTQYYSSTRDDHYATTSGCVECEGLYESQGVMGPIYANCVAGSVPINTYYNAEFFDNALLLGVPTTLPGYVWVRTEGYILPAEFEGHNNDSYSMLTSGTLWNFLLYTAQPNHADFWAVLGQTGETNATAEGYQNLGSLGDIVA